VYARVVGFGNDLQTKLRTDRYSDIHNCRVEIDDRLRRVVSLPGVAAARLARASIAHRATCSTLQFDLKAAILQTSCGLFGGTRHEDA